MLLVCLVLVNLIGYGAYRVIKSWNEPPSFIQPRVIANGPKYEPTPYYPPPKVPDSVKEKAQFEIINRITE